MLEESNVTEFQNIQHRIYSDYISVDNQQKAIKANPNGFGLTL